MRLIAILIALVAALAAAAHADTAPVPAKRPNVVLILVDDAALMDFGAYGGEARTPNIDALAGRGALFTSYHTSPLCSPSRAMLLTGIDNHKTGVATIEEVLPPEQKGKPGYSLRLEPGVTTVAARLKAAGYRTYMTGKWHLGHEPGDLPSAHGFDRSLALDASGADNWEAKPYMPYYRDAPWFEDGKPADMPEAFYSSDLIVDRMIDYMSTGTSNGAPFFAYVAFQAVHIPVQAPREYTARYEGKFDEGWAKLREARWKRAKSLGLIPQDAPLAAMPETMRKWETLTADEKVIYAKAMAVYSGMLEAMDNAIGRLIEHVKTTGELDNTIFIVTSDNGPEPSDPVHAMGMNVWMALNGYNWSVETLGEKGSLAFIGPEWAAAVSSPAKLFKFYTTEGGLRVPFVIAGPGIAPSKKQAPAFVTDVTPTILDFAGVGETAGEGAVPINGRSLRPVLEGTAERTHPDDAGVGIEVSGNAALFKGDYKILRNGGALGDGTWRLYNLAADPGETKDLSAQDPERLKDMRAAYKTYTEQMGVLPMPDGYNVQRQVERNALARQLSFYWWILALAAVMLIGLSVLTWRAISGRFRKRNTQETR
ncbi:MAG: arylsulfatase [Alphaproteobacteria bacterium]|nr:arylsulfatase [Alphaproteobacteria bacterium]